MKLLNYIYQNESELIEYINQYKIIMMQIF